MDQFELPRFKFGPAKNLRSSCGRGLVPAVLVDTGPLVALLDRSDPYHLSCQGTFSSLDDSLVTVWPVVTEAISMLRAYWRAQDALWEMIESGAVQILSLGIDDIPRIRELMRKLPRSADGPGRCGVGAHRRARTAAPHLHLGSSRLSSLSPVSNRSLRHPSQSVVTFTAVIFTFGNSRN